jgi:hypothetical protein
MTPPSPTKASEGLEGDGSRVGCAAEKIFVVAPHRKYGSLYRLYGANNIANLGGVTQPNRLNKSSMPTGISHRRMRRETIAPLGAEL